MVLLKTEPSCNHESVVPCCLTVDTIHSPIVILGPINSPPVPLYTSVTTPMHHRQQVHRPTIAETQCALPALCSSIFAHNHGHIETLAGCRVMMVIVGIVKNEPDALVVPSPVRTNFTPAMSCTRGK